ANTYAGNTSVTSGATLRVNGSTASASTVSVAGGATLGGSGTIGGTTSVAGTLSPGASAGVAGTLTTGALSLAGASVALDLGASGTTGGGVNDLVQVNGNLDLSGASLSINPLSGFNTAGSYVLMSYTGTRTGTFASNNLSGIGYLGVIQYDDTNKQVKLVSIPRVRIAQISNGGTGTFNFVLSGLDSTSAQLSTSVAGTAVTSSAYTGSIGTAVTLTQTSPLGWPATPASISCVDANGTSTGNGTGALGSVAGSAVSLTASQMKAGADITCTFTNTNNGITGVVFNDNGAPSAGVNTATPNDGLRNASEQGISGATVSLTNCAATTYASTTTDGAGAYSLAVPTAQNGQNVCVVLTPPSTGTSGGYIATGANVAGSVLANAGSTSVGGVAYGYTRSSRQVSFTAAASGQAAINFGEVPVSTLTPASSARSVAAGVNAVHAHSFTAGTGGSLSLSLGTGTANPASVSGWSEIAYLDSGCTGAVQPGATRLYPSGSAQTVTAGQVVCFVVQESVPAAAANGNSHAVPVTATLSFTNAAPALSASYSATDTTTVSSSALQLTKAVRNVTQGGSFGTNNQAKPGEVLEYRISYENTTPSPMTTLVINDNTPAYTSFVSAQAGTTPVQLGTCTKVTPANAAPAA
ncbi:putative repeat protein (TIGR01451 family), partial [Pseudacidovorax intermedius]